MSSGCSTMLLACVMTPGIKTFAGRQLNRLPYMVLVFVSRVRTFEGVEASLDLQHVANDVLQFGVEDPRTLVYSVAGVKTHHLVRDAIEGVIECFHEEASSALLLCVVVSQVRIHVGQEGIVNLKIESGLYDRLVFLAQGAANGVVVLLVGSIVLVQASTAWRDRRHEGAGDVLANQGVLEVLDVPRQRLSPGIGDRSDAHRRNQGSNRPTAHGSREILLIVLGER